MIDHPLHGERGFALTGSLDSVTTSENPTPYLNLELPDRGPRQPETERGGSAGPASGGGAGQ